MLEPVTPGSERDSRNARLWLEFAAGFMRMGDDVAVAVKKADDMVAVLVRDMQRKGGAS